jgi:enterochelin esterase family protein
LTRRGIIGAALGGLLSSTRGFTSDASKTRYLRGPDFQPHAGPRGTFSQYTFEDSKIFPGFRHWWGLYLPNPAFMTKPPALMVFQDGMSFSAPTGPWRTIDIFDDLISGGVLPPLVGLFISPGFVPNDPTAKARSGQERSFEYDTLSNAYSDFLFHEILPRAAQYVKWSDDPEMHAIGGHSSGAICAFTVAFNHPDKFRKVYSANGSFTNIRGGDKYPEIVRTSPKRPLKVYMWSDTNDMSTPAWGNWAAANKIMAKALAEAGYVHKFEFGEGTHDPAYAAARFPAALKWLWGAD